MVISLVNFNFVYIPPPLLSTYTITTTIPRNILLNMNFCLIKSVFESPTSSIITAY
jgi:hypothetical protein